MAVNGHRAAGGVAAFPAVNCGAVVFAAVYMLALVLGALQLRLFFGTNASAALTGPPAALTVPSALQSGACEPCALSANSRVLSTTSHKLPAVSNALLTAQNAPPAFSSALPPTNSSPSSAEASAQPSKASPPLMAEADDARIFDVIQTMLRALYNVYLIDVAAARAARAAGRELDARQTALLAPHDVLDANLAAARNDEA